MTLSVLIVDDSEPYLASARDLLEHQGVDVLEAVSTVSDALARASQLRPDVILVDVHLGTENGGDLVRQLREDDCCPGATLILMSTCPESDLAPLIHASHASGFLSKADLSAAAIGRIREASLR